MSKPDPNLTLFAAATIAAAAFSNVAHAQSTSVRERVVIETIIVTAQRREERLQDVPISITVFNQEQLDKRNIVSATDLAAYTPSLSSNNRFGSDNASYAIRGFTQDLRTTASVGVYFAEVVAQRAGQTSTTAGDGAGPGSFFDLENVQVLKGPQGTLFGRNTTGGAIMLTPKKPTYEYEGYVEASAGDYDMRRLQGVVNLPLAGFARLRLGVDYNEREGYQDVVAGADGPHLGSTEYIAGRASLVLDLSNSIENYTIATFSHSNGESDIGQLFACAPPGFGANPVTAFLASACRAQLARRDYDFHDVASQIAQPQSRIRSAQIINTTKWMATDHLTVKNTFAYGEMNTRLRSALFGTDFRIPDTAANPALRGLPFLFANVNPNGGGDMTDQKNVVEELQFQGRTDGNAFVWQGGLYYEKSSPKDFVGNLANSNIYCPDDGDQTKDPTAYRCQDVVSAFLFGGVAPIGSLNSTYIDLEYENKAAYAQATYNISPRFSLTGGIRYTDDETRARISQVTYNRFPALTAGPPARSACVKAGATLPDCELTFNDKSHAPTWLLDVDFRPTDDTLLYAKYTRGYRQGSIVPNAADGFERYKPEKVDAYEIGLKSSFAAPIPVNLNVAAFYNDLKDQQLQLGFFSTIVNPTTAIVNAGESRIAGIEIESRVMPTRDWSIDLGYTYLDTKLKQITLPSLAAGSVYSSTQPSALEGDPLPLSPKHKGSLTTTYRLPFDKSIGDISIGATATYTSEQLTSATSPFGRLPGYTVVNLNLGWSSIMGRPIDAGFFVTNLLDREYETYVPGLFASVGAEYRNVGVPRMLGVRLKYSFGGR